MPHVLRQTYAAKPLRGELLLFQLEHERVKLLLQALVGVVNQQLLQRVGAEGFKSEDVEQSDESARVYRRRGTEKKLSLGQKSSAQWLVSTTGLQGQASSTREKSTSPHA